MEKQQIIEDLQQRLENYVNEFNDVTVKAFSEKNFKLQQYYMKERQVLYVLITGISNVLEKMKREINV